MTYSKKPDALKSQLTKHYDAKSLSATQLSALNDLQKQSTREGAAPQLVVQRTGIALAAMLILAVSVWTFWFERHDYNAISAEIAYNHNSEMQMEILSDSFADIDTYLNRLDFSVVMPSQLPVEKWILLGGRYCSIDGKIAAQLHVKDLEIDRVYTFYQAKLPQGIEADMKNVVTNVDGVNVSLLEENGLLMGLAK